MDRTNILNKNPETRSLNGEQVPGFFVSEASLHLKLDDIDETIKDMVKVMLFGYCVMTAVLIAVVAPML